VPLVTEARSWAEGVYMAATMGSGDHRRCLQVQQGVVRRDPFAMLPFMGYHMGDSLRPLAEAIGAKLADSGSRGCHAIFCVNWFRKGADGKFVWPGYGDTWTGLDFSRAHYQSVMSFDHGAWTTELKLHGELFDMLGERLPRELLSIKHRLEHKLAN
jgi:phosphoenolpyruvate carboxykinase (GTP)